MKIITLILNKTTDIKRNVNESKEYFLEEELYEISKLKTKFYFVAIEKSELLIESNKRFRKVLAGKKYRAYFTNGFDLSLYFIVRQLIINYEIIIKYYVMIKYNLMFKIKRSIKC